VVGLAWLNEPDSHAARVKCDTSHQKKYPGPPGWELGHEAENLIPVKNINYWEILDDSLRGTGIVERLLSRRPMLIKGCSPR
jgi:hypothetical protein